MAAKVQCTVWLAAAGGVSDAAIDAYCDWLNEAEMQRYRRFVRRERQRQFVLGRVLLRQALGALLGVPAREVELAERPDNSPVLVSPECAGGGLSLSHSGPWIACAVSAATSLGIDIEHIDARRDIEALAAHAFSEEELAWLRARPATTRMRDFYTLWSTAEARFKLGVPAQTTAVLEHPALAIVLCSAAALHSAPQLVIASLVPDPAPDSR